jgi:hypothetical protein
MNPSRSVHKLAVRLRRDSDGNLKTSPNALACHARARGLGGHARYHDARIT